MPLTQKGLLLAGIVDALSTLKEIKGSTSKAIVNYIRANPPPDMSKRGITEITIQKAIKSAVENKILRQNAGRFLIDFEGMASLANAAQFSVGGLKSGSFLNAASVKSALLRNTVPVDRASKMACKHKKRRRSRHGCKKRHRKSKRGCLSSRKRRSRHGCKKRHRKSKRGCRSSRKRRSRGCKKRSRRKSSCKKRRRRSRSCKKRSRRKSSCKKRRRRSRGCKKRSRRKSSCKKRRRRSRSCKKRSRRKSSCKKLRRRKSRKCRNENEEDDAMAPEAPMPMRHGERVMKNDSMSTLISVPSLPTIATKMSDNSLTRPPTSGDLVDKMAYKYLCSAIKSST